MYTNFAELPPSARIWIYQASRDFTEVEKIKLEDWLTSFVSRWQSHGAELTGSFKILYDRFIIMGVDTRTNMPSGCSIDSSVAALKEIEQTLNISLFDRTQIAFLEEGGQISTHPMQQIKSLIEEGKIDGEAITFNNLADTKEKLEAEWLVSAKNSWMKRYFAQRQTA